MTTTAKRFGWERAKTLSFLDSLEGLIHMNMIHKTYPCAFPLISTDQRLGSVVREYDISAWQAMGSDSVNIRMRDGWGWGHMVITEKLSSYVHQGVRTMDDLIEYLYWVVKA